MVLSSLGRLQEGIINKKHSSNDANRNKFGYILFKLEQDNIACGLRSIFLQFHNCAIPFYIILKGKVKVGNYDVDGDKGKVVENDDDRYEREVVADD